MNIFPLKGFFLYFIRLPRQISHTGPSKLRTILTNGGKFLTRIRMMTSACKRIHIVQCPDDWQLIGNGPKERGVINEFDNPVQMYDVGLDFIYIDLRWGIRSRRAKYF